MNLGLCFLVEKSPSEPVSIKALLWAVFAESGSASLLCGHLCYVHSSQDPNQDLKRGLEPGPRLGALTHAG